MKIDELNQNAVITQVAAARTDKTEAADAHRETVAKKQPAAVKVELSSYMPVVPTSQKQENTNVSRVEELKAQVQAGTYQVSGRAVAEKMLSKIVMSTTH